MNKKRKAIRGNILITRTQIEPADKAAKNLLSKADVVVQPDNLAKMEVVDFGPS